MATAAGLPSPVNGKINFPNMLGPKRRRMRSGGNVSTQTNNAPKALKKEDPDDEKTAETSKCKGTTTIPIFLKKTYKMIDTCDPKIASWTPDGEMFVVKDPDLFATNVIPQYFDHNKFSSFARQLNFYGFRKMQAKPIRNADFDADTAKHVTFYNEKFKRGRCDLLKEIQRSTRGGGAGTNIQDHQREVEVLRNQINLLEETVSDMQHQMEDRMRRLELDMLGRIEQIMVAMQQNQQTQIHLQQQAVSRSSSTNLGRVQSVGNAELSAGVLGMSSSLRQEAWDPLPIGRSSRTSTSSNYSNTPAVVSGDSIGLNNMPAPATLPPHPKQKQLPPQGLPIAMTLPPSRLNSLRTFSRGISRGLSIESSASAVLLRNSWEDKFFSMLMLGDTEAGAAAAANAATEGGQASAPMSDAAVEAAIAGTPGNGEMASSVLPGNLRLGRPELSPQGSDRSLSSVSTSDIP